MMEVEGDCSLWHHFIFCQELQNNDEEENFIVCWWCQEPLWGGPTYKCLECNFHQHESCREDIEIDKHHHWRDRRVHHKSSDNDPSQIDDGGRRRLQLHHLIFCQELQNNDDENFIDCSLCEEPLRGGPAYKCLECDFLQHESCREDIEIDEHDHFGERHHLIFIEELLDKYNGGMEEVVCPGCQEPAVGPAYKCSFRKCTLFLHKSCSEQLSHVVQHPLHPEHALFLRQPAPHMLCDACYKSCRRSFLYWCFPCDFNLDVICASRWRTDADDCHQHSFIPISAQIQFACQACGEEEPKQFASLCTICRLLIHTKCARYQRTIKTNT